MSAQLYNEMVEFVKRGRAYGYRKIGHATYAILTTSPDGYDWFGVQYHGIVVFGIRDDGCYAFNNGGWYTQTTAKRINDWLRKVGSPHKVNIRPSKSVMLLNGVPYHHRVAFFDAGHSEMRVDIPFFPYRNIEVAELNRKVVSL